MTLKRIMIGLLVIIFIVAGAGWLLRDRIIETVFTSFARSNIGKDIRDSLPDGLHVFFCGTGSPMPDPTRTGTCNGVIAGSRIFIVDMGAGGVRNLGLGQFPTGETERVYLTHLHSDHMEGLGETMITVWINGGRTSPLPVSGPEGVEAVVEGLNIAYGPDRKYRQDHQPEMLDPNGFGFDATTITLEGDSAVVLDEDDLKITAFNVNHKPVDPAFGYRFDYKERSIVFSGDTAYEPNLVNVATGADLLIHEAQSARMLGILQRLSEESGETRMKAIMQDVLSYHTTPEEAAQAAREAGVQELILYHITPPVPVALLNSMFLGDAPREFDGKITLAKDRMLVSLPAGSDKIEYRD